MIERNVTLRLDDGAYPVHIRVSQFDTMWRFVFSIIHNSQPWQIPTGATAVLNGRKPDGNVFAFSGTISDNKVTVDCDVQMTAVAGQTVCELSILANNKTVGTANFILDVEEAPKSADDVVSDTVLDGYGMMVTNAVDSWLNSHSGQIGGLTNEAKQALLTLLAHVAYTDDQGQAYLDALETALYPPVDLLSISAVFNQGDAVIYDTDELDSLKQYLTVTANMSDGTTQTVTNYTLTGTLTPGTSTITVSYGGKTDTFDVDVVEGFVILLHNEDFRITASAPAGAKYDYPYYYDNIATSPKRYSYVAFDLRLEGGKKYRFVATTNYSTAGMGCQFYNQTALNAVNSQSSFASTNIYDPGWQQLTTEIDVPAAQNGSPIVGVRFTFRQDANSPNISSDFAVSLLTVKEVVE